MIDALLRGKLSTQQENMEDVLTACVFGGFKYVNASKALIPFLSEGKASGQLASLLEADDWTHVSYEFWPWWPDTDLANCEPDVVIRVDRNDNKPLLILIEVKFRSGKSGFAHEESEGIADQLALEWAHLVKLARRKDCQPLLYYVTADALMPIADIEAAQDDYEKWISPDDREPFSCHWVSWRSLHRLFGTSQHPILADIGALADKLNLKEYHGMRNVTLQMTDRWRYYSGYRWRLLTSDRRKWEYKR